MTAVTGSTQLSASTAAARGGCPVHAQGAARRPSPTPRTGGLRLVDPATVDLAAAEDFLRLYYAEAPAATTRTVPYAARYAQVRASIEERGSYDHTPAELTFGARVAWRNAARCIGRLYWGGLHVRDARTCSDPAPVAAECVQHLREATRDGRIRSTITVFAPDRPGQPGPRIRNEQLIRYAGYQRPDGSVLGDPRTVELTAEAVRRGWRAPHFPGMFDVLPLLVTGSSGHTELHEVPRDAVLEVALTHPDLDWFGMLGLRWHAVPAISNMTLEIGGVRYPAVPFNGYYLGTEIGARNLADPDRYDMLPTIARMLGLDTTSRRTLWQDRALVELVRAVHHSFDEAGVSMADHHTESDRFLTHVEREQRAGRGCPTDWSWIVPPMSGSATSVFHRYYDPPDPAARPAFLPAAQDVCPTR